jgi:hypothetical protein
MHMVRSSEIRNFGRIWYCCLNLVTAQADMVQVFKILHCYEKADINQWFRLAGENGVRTTLATGVLNLVKPRCNTDMRTNFFSVRVIER